jgi:hypothetical protein
MMTTKKPTKAQRIAELERKLAEALAGQAHTYHFAEQGLAYASQKHMTASGVILTLTALGGREICAPVLIRNGLSEATIEALKADFVRSYQDAIVFKPKGAA